MTRFLRAAAVLCLLVVGAMAQTYHTPTLEGNNVFTGSNTIHVVNEISPAYPALSAPTTYPLGHDLSPITRGAADLVTMQYALEVTASTSCGPGVCSFTVGSPTLNGVAQSGNPTALFGDPSGDSNLRVTLCDAACIPGGSTWESLAYTIVDGTHIQVTAAKAHTTPKIRQQGAHLTKGFATYHVADPTSFWLAYSYNDPSGNAAFQIGLTPAGTWPLSAVLRIPPTVTCTNGAVGLTGGDCIRRPWSTTSKDIWENFGNTAQTYSFDPNAGLLNLNAPVDGNGINLLANGTIVGAWTVSSSQSVFTSNVYRGGPIGSTWPSSGNFRLLNGGDITFGSNGLATTPKNLAKSDSSDRVVIGDTAGVIATGGIQPAATGAMITWFQKATHASLDLASVASGACTAETTETISTAAFGDHCSVDAGTALEAGGFFACKVTASNTVKWQFCQLSGSPIDRASDTYTIRVTR